MRKFIFVIVILLLSQVSMAQTYIDAVVVNEGKDTIFGKIMEINDSTITIDRFNYIFSIPKDLVVSYQANVREASRYERIHMEQMDNLSEKDFGYQTSGYYLRKSSKNFYLGMCLSVAGNTSIIIPLVTHDKLTIADQATLACGIAVSAAGLFFLLRSVYFVNKAGKILDLERSSIYLTPTEDGGMGVKVKF